jgi:capsular polysaccharide transport system ATP-binding protein
MIKLRGVTKFVSRGAMRTTLLDDIDLTIPIKGRLVILAQRGSGKTTLLQIMSGMQLADRGQVHRSSRVSPPGGLLRYARFGASARQHIDLLSRMYRVDAKAILRFVMEVVDIGADLDQPVLNLPGPLRQRLDYALIFAIPFDFYLLDEFISPTSPPEFRDACHRALRSRLRDSGLVFATSYIRFAREVEASAAILHRGKLMLFPGLEDAIDQFQDLPPASGLPTLAAPEAEANEEGEVLG